MRDPSYNEYHDEEWGRPVTDEAGVFERLCLEGFQSGLSWLTILRKRENFRRAFAGFDPVQVAGFDERDIERLLGDAGIVRHRGKIEATIENARVDRRAARVDAAATSSSGNTAATARSRRSGSRRRPSRWSCRSGCARRGFRFVGPTTVYAGMQAIGVVNDHRADCFVREEVEAERMAL